VSIDKRGKPLTTTTTIDTNVVTECTPYAIVLLIALCYILYNEIKVPHSDFLASVIKYESEVNASGKLDIRSESRKRAFDHHDMLDT
jgi:hypothetical protein